MADPDKIRIKQQRFGITARNSLGIYHKDLKVVAKSIGQNDKLAKELFDSGIYEARLLCSKIIDPKSVNEECMEKWVATFENWEICDSFCMSVFSRSDLAVGKAIEWSVNEREFIKRAGFVIMASFGFANKNADNKIFKQFLLHIDAQASDERIYVKKAVNWALRNIGKRNIDLNKAAISTAKKLLKTDSRSAKWIASNALKELKSPNVHMMDYPRSRYR